MGIKDSLKRGTLELLLLTLLNEKDMYAYELSNELIRRSENLFTIQDASMYTALYRLQEKGLISDRKEQIGKRRFRIYYHLEELGQGYLKQITEEYFSIHKGVMNILSTSVGDTNDH